MKKKKEKKLNGKIFFSVIIPVKNINNYLFKESLPHLEKQALKDFEVLVLVDNQNNSKKQAKQIIDKFKFPFRIIKTGNIGPAKKRDIGALRAKGEFLAFIDDDAYPHKEWLSTAFRDLKNKTIAAVGGPGITPPNDNLLSQTSGWLWSSWLGAGGAGTYRCCPGKRREVDDYPTFNLIVKKRDFKRVGGFNSLFWPGEDTKLCHDLVYKLKKKIIYNPKVLVYHRRRQILKDHLKQIGRYGLHRGYFAKILPRTSLRIGYFIPFLFAIGVLVVPVLTIALKLLTLTQLVKIISQIYILTILVYGLLVIYTSLWVLIKSKNFFISLLIIPTIFLSHMYYGLMFAKGLAVKKLVQ